MSYTLLVETAMSLIVVLAALFPQDSYLPLEEGARWTYVVEDVGAEAAAPAGEVVAQVGGSADSDWTRVTNFLGYRECWLRSTAEGIELRLDAKPEAPALTILKPSARTGETWTGTFGQETLTFTMRGEEFVERGETRVRTLHVAFSATDPKHAGHTATHGDVWFAAGVGVVRAQVTTDLDCHTATAKVYQLKP